MKNTNKFLKRGMLKEITDEESEWSKIVNVYRREFNTGLVLFKTKSIIKIIYDKFA